MTEKNILVPLDFTDINKALVRKADEWATRTGAKLFFLHVVPDLTYRFIDPKVENVFHTNDDIITDEIREDMEKFVSDQHLTAPHEHLVLEGKPYTQIIKAQKEHAIDLIIIAAHDHTVVGRLFVGSNTDYILHHVHCPVYVYKEAAD